MAEIIAGARFWTQIQLSAIERRLVVISCHKGSRSPYSRAGTRYTHIQGLR